MAKKSWLSPERITAIVMPLISLLLASFMILLAGKVMDDLGGWVKPPNRAAFFNQSAIAAKQSEIAVVERERAAKMTEVETYQKAIEIAQRNYRSEKESFGNWLAARKTIGSPNEDPMVVQKANELDKVRAVESAWQAKIDEVQTQLRTIDERRTTLDRQRANLEGEAQRQLNTAERAYDLKIFLIRLALTLPFLLLAAYAFAKWRKSKYSPLVWGYILFSVYVFFVGLVPYLPSYGGYVRYAVGIILTVVGGTYAIKNLAAYAERKSLEIQESSVERAKKIDYELAITSYKQHSCPSCEKDYLTAVPADAAPEQKTPKYCFHCGLHLFGPCKQCGTVNFVHFPYCRTCGTGLKQDDVAVV